MRSENQNKIHSKNYKQLKFLIPKFGIQILNRCRFCYPYSQGTVRQL